MGFQERMKRIQEHFSTVTASEVEEKLIKAGVGIISSSTQSNMVMATERDLKVEYNYVNKGIDFEEDYTTFPIILSPLYNEVA